jgi:hypothetical protein
MFRRCATLRDMSTNEILTLLEAERTRLDRAIEALRGTHRGKLPVTPDATGAGSRARRGGMSAAARKEQSQRMRLYWAKRKKTTALASKKKS